MRGKQIAGGLRGTATRAICNGPGARIGLVTMVGSQVLGDGSYTEIRHQLRGGIRPRHDIPVFPERCIRATLEPLVNPRGGGGAELPAPPPPHTATETRLRC